jgi:hypothetical protein
VVKDDPRSEHLERGSRGVATGDLATAELRAQTSATYIYNSIYLEVQGKWEGIPKAQRERERDRVTAEGKGERGGDLSRGHLGGAVFGATGKPLNCYRFTGK